MSALLAARDDGLLARGLGRAHHRLPSWSLAALGVAGVLAAVALGERSDALVLGALGWVVLLGSLARGGPADDRFGWAVPPLLRAGEYAALIWLHPAGAFWLLLALAFHHYDLFHRPRYLGKSPPAFGIGWDGRLVLAAALHVAGALPAGFHVLAALLAGLFVAECVASRHGAAPAGGATP